jgi:hypothetical protein
MEGKFSDIKTIYEFHHVCKLYQHEQFIVDVTCLCVCITLFFPSVYVFVRCLFLKDKWFLLLLSSLLIVGELAGIVVAVCLEELFKIGSDLKVILHTDPKLLNGLANGVTYSTAVFFTSFSIAHWLFAMQYWSLSLRL